MTDTVAIAMIAAVPGTLAAVAAGLGAWATLKNGRKLDEVKSNTDGKLKAVDDKLEAANAALLTLTASSSKDAGKLEQRDQTP
jgi:hypothetical protein